VAHHVVRVDHLAFDQVVGDVEQAVDEQAIAGDALGQLRIAIATHRRLLDEETALGTDRHDHRVLDHLRLDQAQHLGAEILAAVGPAQAAARHRAEAQVDAFHARRTDPDLAIRHRLGQVGHLVRVELEADVAAVCAVPRWKKLVRKVAWISATKLRRMRSSSRLATFSSSTPWHLRSPDLLGARAQQRVTQISRSARVRASCTSAESARHLRRQACRSRAFSSSADRLSRWDRTWPGTARPANRRSPDSD
jgi:hypothetical protein